jgi:signal transduction histidine kinase
MKNWFLLISCIFCLSLSLVAQSTQALKDQLSTATGATRITILHKLTKQLAQSQPEEAKKYAEEAFELSESSNNHKGVIASATYLTDYEKNKKHYRKAAKYAQAKVDAAIAINYQNTALRALGVLMDIYKLDKRKNKLEDAELAYKRLESQLNQKELNKLKRASRITDAENKEILFQNDSLQEELNLTLEEKLQQEILFNKMAMENIQIDLKAQQLENEKLQKELDIKKKESQIEAYNTKLEVQRSRTVILVLVASALAAIILLMIRNNQLKKQQTAERERLQQQLMVREKMASLGQLTAGVAHEIKNPLNFVNNFAEGSTFLLEDLTESIEQNQGHLEESVYEEITELIGEVKQNAVDILAHGKRADRIVNTMMEHSRNDAGDKQLADINELLEDNFNLAYHAFRAKEPDFSLKVDKSLTTEIPPIRIAIQGISRALLNIIDNACYAVNQKRLNNHTDYQPELKLKTIHEDSWIKIYIQDNGPGIDETVRKEIFLPFFTTKPTGKGNTGLGLSMSYDSIVQEHKGTLEIESDGNSYTTFIIGLPTEIEVRGEEM